MGIFDLPSESHFEVRSFLTRITCSLLVQYSRHELLNTWFWQFFLKKIISRAEFDELCYFGTQNPWNFGENCKRIGLNSKNLSIKLIITDDIYWHIFSLCTAECFEGHPLTTRIFWLDWAWLVLKLWFVRTIRVEIIWLHTVTILPLYVE